jgi:hypothetical protein
MEWQELWLAIGASSKRVTIIWQDGKFPRKALCHLRSSQSRSSSCGPGRNDVATHVKFALFQALRIPPFRKKCLRNRNQKRNARRGWSSNRTAPALLINISERTGIRHARRVETKRIDQHLCGGTEMLRHFGADNIPTSCRTVHRACAPSQFCWIGTCHSRP